MRNYELLMHDGPGEDADNDSYYTKKVEDTSKTQAQLDAEANQIATAKLIADAKAAADKAAADKAAADKAAADKAAADKAARDKAARDKAARDKAARDKAAVDLEDTSPIQLTSSLINTSTQPTQPTPTPPTPPPSASPTPPRPPAKTAPIDTVLFDDDFMSPEIMIDLVFEDIGGHELLSISRNDIINGQRVSYSPIKNLGLIQQTYNPNNLLSLQQTSDKYFANFAIKFDEKVPEEGSGDDGANVYIEESTGDLIIETINMNNDEQIESEIAINGTIYEANFGETAS